MERLQKILSSWGVCSRREAERLIAAGRVTVNGEPASTGQSADPDRDAIALDGRRLCDPGRKVYIVLNKPRGYVTTMSDEKGRMNVTELVSGCGLRVYPAGRLDMDSEGVLLLTNDGDFANAAAHPSGGKEKVYLVTVSGDVSAALPSLGMPIEIDGKLTRPAAVRVVSEKPDGGVLEFTISEGRNRQVRRLCEAGGLSVRRLVRTRVGSVTIDGLESGRWRHLTEEEVKSFLTDKLQK